MNSDLTCLRNPGSGKPLVQKGDFLYSDNGKIYPIVKGIPRFVGSENYSGDFGFQWNTFPRTQLDSYTGLNISESRLERCMQIDLKELKGKRVLEAGSGAGRFTEILLKYGAIVHSFDYSNAVEANGTNNGAHQNLVLVQGDIQKIPFPKEFYDYVICLGVLQHTPSPEESIKYLWEMVRPGGGLVIDHYLWKLRFFLPPPFGGSAPIYRQLILRLPSRYRFKAVKVLTKGFFPLHWFFRNSLFMQRIIRRISPVNFYYPYIKLRDRQMYFEWALLDTHDATTDFYKHHRRPNQIRKFLEDIGASSIVLRTAGNGIEAFGRKVPSREANEKSSHRITDA